MQGRSLALTTRRKIHFAVALLIISGLIQAILLPIFAWTIVAVDYDNIRVHTPPTRGSANNQVVVLRRNVVFFDYIRLSNREVKIRELDESFRGLNLFLISSEMIANRGDDRVGADGSVIAIRGPFAGIVVVRSENEFAKNQFGDLDSLLRQGTIPLSSQNNCHIYIHASRLIANVLLLWIVLSLCMWYVDVLALMVMRSSGKTRKRCCNSCGYERAGLGVRERCPECGARPS